MSSHYPALLTASLLCFQVATARVTPEQLVKLAPSFCGRYTPDPDTSRFIALPVDFNSAQVLNRKAAKLLAGRSIKSITLYYTVYRFAEKFDQPALNLERFKDLYTLLPSAFNNAVIRWEIKGQTDCKDAEEAKTFFHGFVVEYIPAPSLKSILAEKSRVEYMAQNDSLGKDTVYYTETFRIRKRRKWTGYFLPRSEKKKRGNVVYRERSMWKRDKQYVTIIDTLRFKTKVKRFKPSAYGMSFLYRNTSDTTVLAVLNRHPSWKNMVLVVDVTGSMGPYTSQLFVWFKLNSVKRNVKNLTYFNDGDSRPDQKKRVGATGGIYFADALSPSDAVNIGTQAMLQGGGGDAPENNCEAILHAINKNPNCKELFMIADNWANMRDISLADKIKKPVHIILCGVSGGMFNTQYLDLARKTGGSIHTIDKDIENLLKLSEGEKIRLGSKEYIIRKGKFELLNQI